MLAPYEEAGRSGKQRCRTTDGENAGGAQRLRPRLRSTVKVRIPRAVCRFQLFLGRRFRELYPLAVVVEDLECSLPGLHFVIGFKIRSVEVMSQGLRILCIRTLLCRYPVSSCWV